MTLTTRRLQEIHADLWGSHDLPLLSRRIYVDMLFDEFTRKSCVLLLRSKDEFFGDFKLWFLRTKLFGEKLRYLQTDGGEEFTSVSLKSFCNGKNIPIGYTASYMHKKNIIAE